MIAQLSKGSSFGGLVNYANDIEHKQTNIIASDGVSLKNNKTITASFKAQARSNPKVKEFVGHVSLSFSPEDTKRMSDSLVREIALQYLHRMGIRNTQFVIFRHHDQPHDHVHIVYNRVDNNGNEIKSDSNFLKSAAITKILTREYNLTFGNGKDKVRRNRLRGKDAAKYRIYDTLKAALEKCQTWKQLENYLNKEKITFRVTYRADGLAKGMSFSDGKFSFAGSKIDKSMTYWNINNALVENCKQTESDFAHSLTPTENHGVGITDSMAPYLENTSATDLQQNVHQHDINDEDTSIAEDVLSSAESVAEGVSNTAANIGGAIIDMALQPDTTPIVSSGGGGSSSKDDDDDEDKNKNKKRPQKISYTPIRRGRR